jgi:hypothetical protein
MDTLHHGMDTLRYGRVMPRLPVADLRKAVEVYTRSGYLVILTEETDDPPTCAPD